MTQSIDVAGLRRQLELFSYDAAPVMATTRDPRARRLITSICEMEKADPKLSFLDSAFCTMSLPARQPANPYKPIQRTDGRYQLLIAPKSVPGEDGEPVCYGVPFGPKARLILVYMMSEARRNSSPEIYLGNSLSHFMRRMGYSSDGGGKTGALTGVREQLRRLLRCEWTIRFVGDDNSETVQDVALATGYEIFQGDAFVKRIRFSDAFFNHLMRHSVPLDERALAQLRDNATAIDLYTWLAFRLPNVDGEIAVEWERVRKAHFGLESPRMRDFQRAIRDAWIRVQAVYPAARADFSRPDMVVLRESAPPVEKDFLPRRSHLTPLAPPTTAAPEASEGTPAPKPVASRATARKTPKAAAQKADKEEITFPEGSLSFGGPAEKKLREIALDLGGGWDVDRIAEEFRKVIRDRPDELKGAELIRCWAGFCRSYADRRASRL